MLFTILPLLLLATTPAPDGLRLAKEAHFAADHASVLDHCRPLLQSEGDDELACRLLSGSSLLSLHRPAEAKELLTPARSRLGVLEGWGALLLGEALAASGDADSALKLLAEAAATDSGGPLARRAEIPRALAAARAGRLAEAKKRILPLTKRSGAPRAKLLLALAEASEKPDRAGALRLHRQVWLEHPKTAEAARAAERIETLEGAPLRPTPAERIERAQRLVDMGKNEAALAELAKAARPTEEETEDSDAAKGSVLAGPEEAAVERAPAKKAAEDPHAPQRALLLSRALFALGRGDEAEEILAPALRASAPAALRLDARMHLARILMRRMDVDGAVAQLGLLQKEAKGPLQEEAAFLAAFFLYDGGRFEEAAAAFEKVAARWPRGKRAEDVRWYLGWTKYKQGKFAAAIEAFARLSPRGAFAEQGRYWSARAYEKAGDEKRAHALYREVVKRDPTSWYALLSRARLELPPAKVDFSRFSPPKEGPASKGLAGARLKRAVALYEVGLVHEAGEELDAALRASRAPALVAHAARLAFDAGDHHRAWQLGLFRLGGMRRAADLAYPLAFAEQVEHAAAEHGVDAHFVWSIMRQESGFRPRVRSPANAVGLMQVLPTTARRLAVEMQIDPKVAERLDDPRVNVRLGSFYLGRLLQRFDGSFALAAAAYNAGPPAVARWMAEPARKDLPLDEFVESIPFRETRGYVKKVMANFASYRLIHGGEPLSPRKELPPLKPGIDY